MRQKNSKLGAVVAGLMTAAMTLTAMPTVEAAVSGETCAAVTCLSDGSVQWVQLECTGGEWVIVDHGSTDYDESCESYGPFENNSCTEECTGDGEDPTWEE